MSKKVSVLVHTKNSARTVGMLLESIKNQSYRPIEIISVDNHSTDGTLSVLRKYTKHVYTYGPERSAQRNFAAKAAQGAYYFIPDADMILEKDVILDCVTLLESNKDVKAAIIPERTVGIGFWAAVKAFERGFYLGDDTIEAPRFFDARVFWEFGGYDETMTGPEDWDLPERMKGTYRVGRVTSFITHDEGYLTISGLAKKKYYYGKSAAGYLKKHPSSDTLTRLVYFLRPVFYSKWRRFLRHPIMSVGMVIMLIVEQAAGGLGYLSGKSS